MGVIKVNRAALVKKILNRKANLGRSLLDEACNDYFANCCNCCEAGCEYCCYSYVDVLMPEYLNGTAGSCCSGYNTITYTLFRRPPEGSENATRCYYELDSGFSEDGCGLTKLTLVLDVDPATPSLCGFLTAEYSGGILHTFGLGFGPPAFGCAFDDETCVLTLAAIIDLFGPCISKAPAIITLPGGTCESCCTGWGGDIPGNIFATLSAGSGSVCPNGSTLIFSGGVCESGGDTVSWSLTGLSGTMTLTCTNGQFTVRVGCPSPSFAQVWPVTVTSKNPFAATATVTGIPDDCGGSYCDGSYTLTFYE